MGLQFLRTFAWSQRYKLDSSGKAVNINPVTTQQSNAHAQITTLSAPGIHPMSESSLLTTQNEGLRGVEKLLGSSNNVMAKDAKSERQILSSDKNRKIISSIDKISVAPNVNFVFDHRHRIIITDADGVAFTPEQEWRIRQNYREEILSLLNSRCDQHNQELYKLLNCHAATPDPDEQLSARIFYHPLPDKAPEEPQYKHIRWLDRLLPWRNKSIELQNHILEHQYRREQVEWQRRVDQHEQEYLKYWNSRFSSAQNIERFLTRVIKKVVDIENIDIQLTVDRYLNTVSVNVRLPEITQLPGIEYKVLEKELRLSCKSLSPTRKRQYYMQHVHGIGFRLIGEIFRTAPVSCVIFSGFCRRLNPINAHIEEEYLYSVKVKRAQWQEINFSNLEGLNLPDVIKAFSLRRNMTKTGIFRAITPFSEESDGSEAQQDIFISHDAALVEEV